MMNRVSSSCQLGLFGLQFVGRKGKQGERSIVVGSQARRLQQSAPVLEGLHVNSIKFYHFLSQQYSGDEQATADGQAARVYQQHAQYQETECQRVSQYAAFHLADTDRLQYNQLVDANAHNIEAIQVLFNQIYHQRLNDVNTDKIYKQFNQVPDFAIQLLQTYNQQLATLEKQEERVVRELRKTYAKLRQSMRSQSMSESERGVGIEMVEINQETMHYERMIEIKQKQILTIKDRMNDALKVQQQLKTLVFEQGEILDKAEGNIEEANRNVHGAAQNLLEAREEHISSRKKQVCIFGIILAIVLAITVPLLIKFA